MKAKSKVSILTSLFITLSPIFSLLLTGCGQNTTPVSQTGIYFDTAITITIYDSLPTNRSNEIFQQCFSLCQNYDKMLSRTKEDSDIWKINHAGGRPVEVHPETVQLLQKALHYCTETDGTVDITIAPLSALWNFSSENLTITEQNTPPMPPAQSQIQKLLPHVDYHNVHINGTTVTLSDPDAALDLGCIAKGYIADRLKEYLVSQEIQSAIIDLGGNLLTLGNKPDGSDFTLGIRRPFDAHNTIMLSLSVSDASLVSSGVYERYYELDGVRYHHLLNTATGLPENNGLLGVTILSASSAEGDILSTACFLLGLEKGMAYVESLPAVEAVFITEDYEIHTSSGLSGFLQKR